MESIPTHPNFLLAIMGYDTSLGLSSEMGVPIFCFEMECKFRVCFLTPIKKVHENSKKRLIQVYKIEFKVKSICIN
jgi:hypothetical protein